LRLGVDKIGETKLFVSARDVVRMNESWRE